MVAFGFFAVRVSWPIRNVRVGIRWVIALAVIVSGSVAVLAARLRLTTKKGEEKATTN